MEERLVDRITERVTLSVTEGVTSNVTERIGGRIDAFEERLKDFIVKANHDLETRIITEFHK